MPSWQPVPPSVSISGAATVTEGNAGATKATLDVHLSAPSGGTVTVQYHTIDGTAQGTPALRADYVSKTDSVTFLPGELSKSIDVDVLGDTLDEADETFTVELSSASGAALDPAASTGEVTIIDDDPLPTITIHDASVTEGNTALVEVTLSSASGRPVTVGWSTADGTAHQPDDYAGAGTITFDPNLGQTSQTIQVATVADTLDEFDETFVVSLSAPTNATIAGASATVTIIDDDTAAVSIDDVSAAEGNFGTTPFAFTVSLSTATDHPITVDYTTVDGTATFATDYYRTYGSLTFLATDPLKRTLTVQVAGDTTVEPDETFTVVLSNASSAVGRSPGLGTIRNDDAPTGTPVETVSLPTVAGGTVTTDTEGDGATASDPVETWVMTPNAGTVSITEAPAVLTPTAFSFLGWDVTITAPRATAANPLVLVFRLDATLVPSNPTSFQVFRNGVQVPDCTGAGAVPDPCVAGRNLLPGGDLELTVRTSAASRWTFARAIVSSGEVDGEELRSSSGGEASLEAEAHRGRIGGRLRFHDRTTRFRSREITALAIAADGQSAWLAGQGEDGRTFVAFVAESRGHRSDRFQLWIAGVNATGDGRLDRGEIDIERGEGREQQDGARD
jgi:hypothetical protein